MKYPGTVSRIGNRDYHLVSDDDYLAHVGREFEPDVVALLSSFVRPGDWVFDVGANIGCTALLFSQSAARVYGFEPSQSTFRFLAMNIDAARAKNVRLVNLGLGNTEASFTLTFAPNNRAGGFISDRTQASAGHRIEDVAIVVGDEFVEREEIERLDFVKIDVEGFEMNVIDGLRRSIERFRPVVVLELNHWCLNALRRTSVPDFLDFLRGIFPSLYAVDKTDVKDLHDPDQAYHVMYHHMVNNFRYPNLVGAFDRSRLDAFFRRFSFG